MTVTVLRSMANVVSSTFEADVEAHRQALLNFRFAPAARLAVPGSPAIPMVPARGGRPARAGRPAVSPIPAVAGTPAPTAHPLIESCIRRVPQNGTFDDYVTDYVIVDG